MRHTIILPFDGCDFLTRSRLLDGSFVDPFVHLSNGRGIGVDVPKLRSDVLSELAHLARYGHLGRDTHSEVDQEAHKLHF